MRKILIFMLFLLLSAYAAIAVETTKPATHNTSWEKLHGQASKVSQDDCLSCHVERIECIACHEDVAPRNHSVAWVQKNHGLESRWNRMSCVTCHKEDFCSSCHETAVPMNHNRSGFGTLGEAGFHCQTGCQLPRGNWKNTPNKNCLVCHKTRPILPSTGQPHQLN